MGDSSFFQERLAGQEGGSRSRFGKFLPHFAQEALPGPVAPGGNGTEAPPVNDVEAPLRNGAGSPRISDPALPNSDGQSNPVGGADGAGAKGTQIKPAVSSPDAIESPPSYKEALEYRRGEVNDHLAERDRWLYRAGQCVWNTVIAYRGARIIEPVTALEQTQLAGIEAAMATSAGPGLARLGRDREFIWREIEMRGRWRGPLCVLGVTGADYAVDQVLFPKDHIKYGTLLADFGGAMGMMFMEAPWRYKALGMVGAHIAGRIYDHFIQGKEASNAYKPRPAWYRSPSVDRALGTLAPKGNGASSEGNSSTEPVPDKPVYRPPNADLVNEQAAKDEQQRELNAARQKQSQEEAQRRYQSWQEALNRWREEHPEATAADQAKFMRDWFGKNR